MHGRCRRIPLKKFKSIRETLREKGLLGDFLKNHKRDRGQKFFSNNVGKLGDYSVISEPMTYMDVSPHPPRCPRPCLPTLRLVAAALPACGPRGQRGEAARLPQRPSPCRLQWPPWDGVAGDWGGTRVLCGHGVTLVPPLPCLWGLPAPGPSGADSCPTAPRLPTLARSASARRPRTSRSCLTPGPPTCGCHPSTATAQPAVSAQWGLWRTHSWEGGDLRRVTGCPGPPC